ncbi:unnamed protein product [Sympodiomycopsis kandeliae]
MLIYDRLYRMLSRVAHSMVKSVDETIVSALLASCPYLGSKFESKGSNQILATEHNAPRLLFGKCTSAVEQVLGEAASLNAMQNAFTSAGLDVDRNQGLTPRVHTWGETESGPKAWLVTDYSDFSGGLSPATQKTLGTKLAQMHLHGTSKNGKFGFERPTHCGETEQNNSWNDSWASFWADQRIGDLIKRIDKRYGGDAELVKLEGQMRKSVYPHLLDTLRDVKPAILHGDLWSGNAGQDTSSGEPIIFDPSSYYGHNEAELGIMKMFGGFSSAFFEAYHAVLPRSEPQEFYAQRLQLYELYHHINHALMFGGGGYRSGAIRIMRQLIDWAESEQGKAGSRKSEL